MYKKVFGNRKSTKNSGSLEVLILLSQFKIYLGRKYKKTIGGTIIFSKTILEFSDAEILT